jgi:hypothetical protein
MLFMSNQWNKAAYLLNFVTILAVDLQATIPTHHAQVCLPKKFRVRNSSHLLASLYQTGRKLQHGLHAVAILQLASHDLIA